MRVRPRLLLAASALCIASAGLAATLTVMVQQTQVRSRPQFFAPPVATVRLGDHLNGDPAGGGWYQVTSGDVTGFIHESAVTDKKVDLTSASAGDSGTTAQEITLAGKGFNDQVESSYKAGNPNLDFSLVDAMEKRTTPDAKLAKFMKGGGLMPPAAPAAGGPTP